MARKVFISVLGATFYNECVYGKVDVNTNEVIKYTPTRFVQQATLEYLGASEWTANDAAYIFTTRKARENNWNESITEQGHYVQGKWQVDPYIGLEKVIKEMNLPFMTTNIDIPDGNGEVEMWKIFSAIFNVIQDGDELYFDLTHSFRYIPMLVLVLGNYAKFLRNVTICSITYGNFEVSKSREDKIAPIVDLMSLTILQDWTFAAADMIRNGNSDRLSELSRNNYLTQMLRSKKPEKQLTMNENIAEGKIKNYISALHEMLLDLRLCRLPQILSGGTMKNVNSSLSQAQSQLKADNGIDNGNSANANAISIIPPILEKIKGTFDGFSSKEDINNGYLAAKWCCEHQLYQQAITILHENITTDMCQKLGISERIYANRDFAAYYLRESKFGNEDLKRLTKEDSEKVNKKRKELEPFIKKFQCVAKWIHKKRNTYDHAAMSYEEKKNGNNVEYVEGKLTTSDIKILKDTIIPYVFKPTNEKKDEILKLF